MFTLDFETEAIDGHIPPVPVGLAIKENDHPSEYLAWGHPTANNCTQLDGYRRLSHIIELGQPVLFHHSKFDCGVMWAQWKLWPKHPLIIHDTVFLLFMDDPYADNLSLKPSAERLLGHDPEEQDLLYDWIMQNTACTKRSEAGAWISHAPGDLTGEYACGDVDRTFDLFNLLYPRIIDSGMSGAYEREQHLMPHLFESEQRGVRVDRERLEQDLGVFESNLVLAEDNLRSTLRNSELDFDKNAQIADGLEAAGLIRDEGWVLTPTGKRSTRKDNLEIVCKDPSVTQLLRYRGAMASALRTFARPWLVDSAFDGRLHTQWNQVRTRGERDDKGTRTGRMSSSRPNLMNVSNELKVATPEGFGEGTYGSSVISLGRKCEFWPTSKTVRFAKLTVATRTLTRTRLRGRWSTISLGCCMTEKISRSLRFLLSTEQAYLLSQYNSARNDGKRRKLKRLILQHFRECGVSNEELVSAARMVDSLQLGEAVAITWNPLKLSKVSSGSSHISSLTISYKEARRIRRKIALSTGMMSRTRWLSFLQPFTMR
jgi:hypothetical protein